MSPPAPAPRRLPRLGVALLAAGLVALFVVAGFPYDRVREILAAELGQATGARVSIARLGPSLSLLGPGVAAQGVVTTLYDGTQLHIERARLRPAWSSGWLSGEPALRVDLEASLGRGRGTLYGGARPGFAGRLRDLDLGRLPLRALLPRASLEGVGESELDVRRTPLGAAGRVHLRGWDGTLAVPGLPLALPFAELEGDLRLGDASLLEIERFELEGPMLALRVTGSVGEHRLLEEAPVRLDAEFDVREPSLRPTLRALGIAVGPNGSARVRLVGTLGSLVIR